jgi:hypothetical protein
MNLGVLITKAVNDRNDEYKRTFLKKINDRREKLRKEQDIYLEKKNYVFNTYEKKRIENDEVYKNFYSTFMKLKELGNIENFKNLKRPDISLVDDIYTCHLIRNERFKN